MILDTTKMTRSAKKVVRFGKTEPAAAPDAESLGEDVAMRSLNEIIPAARNATGGGTGRGLGRIAFPTNVERKAFMSSAYMILQENGDCDIRSHELKLSFPRSETGDGYHCALSVEDQYHRSIRTIISTEAGATRELAFRALVETVETQERIILSNSKICVTGPKPTSSNREGTGLAVQPSRIKSQRRSSDSPVLHPNITHVQNGGAHNPAPYLPFREDPTADRQYPDLAMYSGPNRSAMQVPPGHGRKVDHQLNRKISNAILAMIAPSKDEPPLSLLDQADMRANIFQPENLKAMRKTWPDSGPSHNLAPQKRSYLPPFTHRLPRDKNQVAYEGHNGQLTRIWLGGDNVNTDEEIPLLSDPPNRRPSRIPGRPSKSQEFDHCPVHGRVDDECRWMGCQNIRPKRPYYHSAGSYSESQQYPTVFSRAIRYYRSDDPSGLRQTQSAYIDPRAAQRVNNNRRELFYNGPPYDPRAGQGYAGGIRSTSSMIPLRPQSNAGGNASRRISMTPLRSECSTSDLGSAQRVAKFPSQARYSNRNRDDGQITPRFPVAEPQPHPYHSTETLAQRASRIQQASRVHRESMLSLQNSPKRNNQLIVSEPTVAASQPGSPLAPSEASSAAASQPNSDFVLGGSTRTITPPTPISTDRETPSPSDFGGLTILECRRKTADPQGRPSARVKSMESLYSHVDESTSLLEGESTTPRVRLPTVNSTKPLVRLPKVDDRRPARCETNGRES